MNPAKIWAAIGTVPILSLMLTTTALTDEHSQLDIQQGYMKHAALAQYYRWYQLYERPDGGIENALDILSEDVTVTSGLGEAKGHKQYSERVSQLPPNWQNAHHVKHVEITVNDSGDIDLSADITYLNLGMNPDGKVRTSDLAYSMSLIPTNSVLPQFSDITITQNSDNEAAEFEDAYGKNRLLSLVHYWLALIEDPARNPEPVREILADQFSLNFSSGAITDFDGFKAWLAGPGSSVSASTHEISNFSYEILDENEYALSVDFDWTGIVPGNAEMVAKTRHKWKVSNSQTDRFAKIKTVDVEVLEKFRPK